MTGYLGQDEIDALLHGKKEKEFIRSAEKVNHAKALPERDRKPVVERVEFAPFRFERRAPDTKPDLRFFDSIPLLISGELGTAEITVRELLKLEEGSVVKLNKMVGDSSTLLVNEQYLGQAEVVIINDRFGMRVTAIGAEEMEIDEEKDDKKIKRRETTPRPSQTTSALIDSQDEAE